MQIDLGNVCRHDWVPHLKRFSNSLKVFHLDFFPIVLCPWFGSVQQRHFRSSLDYLPEMDMGFFLHFLSMRIILLISKPHALWSRDRKLWALEDMSLLCSLGTNTREVYTTDAITQAASLCKIRLMSTDECISSFQNEKVTEDIFHGKINWNAEQNSLFNCVGFFLSQCPPNTTDTDLSQ